MTGREERRHQAGVGRRLEEIEQAPGMIAVGVGQPDPPDGRRIDDLRSAAMKSLSGRPSPVSMTTGSLSVQHEGVDREESQARYLEMVIETP